MRYRRVPQSGLRYGGPLSGFWAPGLGRTESTEWELEHGHFVERFQLFVIIVLGESIVVTGATAAQLALTPSRMLAIAVAFLGTAVLWWLYFDEVAERSQAQLAAAGAERGRLARDAFTYLHIPIVAGMLVTGGSEVDAGSRSSRTSYVGALPLAARWPASPVRRWRGPQRPMGAA